MTGLLREQVASRLEARAAQIRAQQDGAKPTRTCGDSPNCGCRATEIAGLRAEAVLAADEITGLHRDVSLAQLKSEQLEEAMSSRAVIEQAKGMIMLRMHCSPQEAFDVLVNTSRRTNRKLRDIAELLVEDCQRKLAM